MARKTLTKADGTRVINTNPYVKPYLVTLEDAQIFTGMGQRSALKLAEEAGAIVRVGRNRRINIQKLESYIDAISTNQ